MLHEVEHHPKKLHSSIIARLKIMTGTMTIDEKRVPQDGRIQMKFQDKELDLRVSIVPDQPRRERGHAYSRQVLAASRAWPTSDSSRDDQEIFEQLITLPDGIILVTGPTGSGKTTTLYACLNFINRPDRKIITVEDPVEYELPGINQVMVKEDIGMTFAAALRAMLRQAPNIIMIGEIRDMETATIAINASLTGHLVFTTLHTNDAPSAVSASDRHRRQAVPHRLGGARHHGPAPGAQAVHGMQGPGQLDGEGNARRSASTPRMVYARDHQGAGRLSQVPPARIPRPPEHRRNLPDRRRGARHDQRTASRHRSCAAAPANWA